MKRIFGKSFSFKVENYEEWKNQKCINQGLLDAEIICVRDKDLIKFDLIGMDKLNIDPSFILLFTDPYTMILEQNKELINKGRIQYFGKNRNPATPYLCHLFCQYGTIEYVRFAFTDSVDATIPVVSRMYEFYGDMTELGDLSPETMEKVKGRTSGMKTYELKYKEDRYSQMLRNTIFNPFGIRTEPILNQGLVMPDLTEVFKNDLLELIEKYPTQKIPLEKIMGGYVFNGIESYYKNGDYVPKVIVDYIIESVWNAANRTKYAYLLDNLESFKYNIYYALTH